MAEGFEPYHVPQQSRRDKLRIVAQNHPHDQFHALLPLYDPSSLLSSSSSSDLVASCKDNSDSVCVVKEEASNSKLMAAFASSSSTPYHPYLDPQSSNLPLNPSTSIHDINGNFFPYTPHNFQNLKPFESFYNVETDLLPFKHEALSLSLSSQSNLPLELNLQRYGGSAVTATGGYAVPGGLNGITKSAVPLGPFTGYASILKGSRFLKPAQQLLEEFCDVGRAIYGEKITIDASFFDPSTDCFNSDDPLSSAGDGSETRRNKSRLILMLDEVYRRYKYYYQQMQAVVASFECVAGLGNAAPFANLALKTMSKHFKALKNTITNQLQFTNKGCHGQLSLGKEEATRFGNYDKGLYVQRPLQNSGFIDHHPVWRPQRGLPERAVIVLKAWLFEHFLHPYPTDTDKLMLAKQTGLSRSQVSNWFINARVRLWKPMVEEIHMLETQQAQTGSQRQEQNAIKSNNRVPASNSVLLENPSTTTQRAFEIPSKRNRNDLPELAAGNEEPLNISCNGMSTHPPIGVGLNKSSRSSSVSLTLGLHQNNGMGVSEPFPMNAAQRFGLGIESSDGLVMGSFEAQDRHFGRDVTEGQLLHDFEG